MNVIICDDVNEDALHLKNIIKAIRKNAHIAIFNSAYDLLAYISEGKSPDICFLDILMPQMDGITLAQNIRENSFTGHIVFLTNSNDYAAQSYKVKAASYLLKPPDKKEVEKTL